MAQLKKPKRGFSQILWRIGAIKFGAFTLTSGKLSPYYIDLRVTPSFPEAFHRMIQIYITLTEKIGADRFKAVAGIPTAGMAYSAVLAYSLKKAFIYVRREAKDWGQGRRIEGILMPGDQVLLLDDLITTGRSISDAAHVIRAEGGIVKDAIVLVDRQERGLENLAKEGIKLHSFMKVAEVASSLYELEEISREQYEVILKQVSRR